MEKEEEMRGQELEEEVERRRRREEKEEEEGQRVITGKHVTLQSSNASLPLTVSGT